MEAKITQIKAWNKRPARPAPEAEVGACFSHSFVWFCSPFFLLVQDNDFLIFFSDFRHRQALDRKFVWLFYKKISPMCIIEFPSLRARGSNHPILYLFFIFQSLAMLTAWKENSKSHYLEQKVTMEDKITQIKDWNKRPARLAPEAEVGAKALKWAAIWGKNRKMVPNGKGFGLCSKMEYFMLLRLQKMGCPLILFLSWATNLKSFLR